MALLAAAGAPDALLMTLIQTRVPPEAWISAQAWERDPKGVQGAIMRLRMPTGPVSVILRAGDPKWAWGLRQAKEPSPEGLYEAEPEAGDGRPLGDVIAEWLNEIAVNADGLSALAAVVEDAGLPEPVAPDAVLHPHAGILPSAIAGSAVLMRVRNSVDKLPKLPGEVGGDGGDGWLPRLDPGVGSLLRHPIIEILHAGGLPAFPRRSGAPWALRIAFEALLDVPSSARASRAAGGVELEYPMRGDGDGTLERILWPAGHPSWWRDWVAFYEALALVGQITIPADEGRSDWFPIIVRSRPRQTGGVLRLAVKLPPGSTKGPRILRRVLRRLGARSYRQWRAWLALAYLWDRSAVNGRWVRATRPRVARDSAGRLVDAAEGVILDRRGAPVAKWSDPRAVLLDGYGRPVKTAVEADREPNPEARRHPWLSANEIVTLGYPPDQGLSNTGWRKRKERMLRDLATFNREGLAETHRDGNRWRVLPPGKDPE